MVATCNNKNIFIEKTTRKPSKTQHFRVASVSCIVTFLQETLIE